jgi:hypothetical protein
MARSCRFGVYFRDRNGHRAPSRVAPLVDYAAGSPSVGQTIDTSVWRVGRVDANRRAREDTGGLECKAAVSIFGE